MIERDAADTLRIYIDDAMITSFDGGVFRDPGIGHWLIGSTGNGSLSVPNFRGYMAEVRLTKAALYASDGGFAVPTAAFPRGDGGGDPHFDYVTYLMQDHTDGPLSEFSHVPDRSRIGSIADSVNGTNVITTANQRGSGSATRAGAAAPSRSASSKERTPTRSTSGTAPSPSPPRRSSGRNRGR